MLLSRNVLPLPFIYLILIILLGQTFCHRRLLRNSIDPIDYFILHCLATVNRRCLRSQPHSISTVIVLESVANVASTFNKSKRTKIIPFTGKRSNFSKNYKHFFFYLNESVGNYHKPFQQLNTIFHH